MDLPYLDKRFLSKLKNFAARGYAFDADHFLRKGTGKDPEAKGTQREAFDNYVKGFEAGNRHGYFEIPTGVGKTPIFISLLKNYLDAVEEEKDAPRSLIVVPNQKLIVQTAKALAKFLPDLAPTIEADDDAGKEIDWKNSGIGVQYGKTKHAERKPRILITTYQSLIRDRKDKIYPPDEYGMVIYDEGHAITANQYGTAVNKFNKAIQLAVTATPEYSENKTVAERLPHCYYQLPLAEAINRGDLCNVRPVLLKTNYTVDKEKFRKYVEQNHGRYISDDQLTDLLNQQARNTAAMETYLLGKDPDSGEPYLGQNGMIFCGNVVHVDDFTRQFSELLDKPNYRSVKDWLEKEDIELIAPIHGRIQGAYLKKGLLKNKSGQTITENRKYEGNKEWYSEDEIFDLHARGKILLLASVKKLREGYDAPRDCIVIDLVDRLSKVDATQIVGRGFRINPKNPEYNDPGNPDKTCTVINLVDKNTLELYQDKPNLFPIYCAEVIEGAEFRKPSGKRYHFKRFNNPPPEMGNALATADFKLEMDIEKVKEVSAQHKKKREEVNHPEKTKDWFAVEDMKTATGRSGKWLRPVFAELRMQWEQKGEKTHIRAGGIIIPVTSVGIFQPHKGPAVFCVNKDVIELFGRKEKSDEWLTSKDVATLFGRSDTRTVKPIFDALQSAWETRAVESTNIEAEGIRLPVDACMITDAGSRQSFCVNKNHVEQFEARFHIPPKTGEWLSLLDMNTRLGTINSSKTAEIYDGFKQALRRAMKGQTTLESGGLSIPIEWASIRKGKATAPEFCLHIDAFSLFQSPKKTDDWLGAGDMSQQLSGISNTPSILQLYRDLKQAYETRSEDQKIIEAQGIQIPIELAGFRENTSGGMIFCLHQNCVETIQAEYKKDKKTDDWVYAKEAAALIGVGHGKVYAFYRRIKDAWEQRQPDQKSIEINDVSIPVDRCGMKISDSSPVFALHKDIIPVISTYLKRDGRSI